jgi:peptidoglycan/xylan/chitin deacetylase (PgdA/CDA1 family)
MIDSIQRLVRATDRLLARAYLGLIRERGGLLVFLFHSLFRDEREIALNQVDPLDRTTSGQFLEFVEYYRDHGYRFIAPDDLWNDLRPDGKYALITFDDGYFNNTLALPVLEKYQVPAVFFVSTDHVRQNKCFWWDVLYRERLARGASPSRVYREGLALKSRTTEQIEADLKARFGADSFRPRGDIDRPFTPAELRDFARSPHVRLGNHTANHAILTNYPTEEVRAQIRRAQESLTAMTGVSPCAIAYPNGAWSRIVGLASIELGLRFGFTTRPAKNTLPIEPGSPAALGLGRFTLHGNTPISAQCRAYRSDLQLYGLCRDGYLRLARGGAYASVPTGCKGGSDPCPTPRVLAAPGGDSS